MRGYRVLCSLVNTLTRQLVNSSTNNPTLKSSRLFKSRQIERSLLSLCCNTKINTLARMKYKTKVRQYLKFCPICELQNVIKSQKVTRRQSLNVFSTSRNCLPMTNYFCVSMMQSRCPQVACLQLFALSSSKTYTLTMPMPIRTYATQPLYV